jgi:hypothetical protein
MSHEIKTPVFKPGDAGIDVVEPPVAQEQKTTEIDQKIGDEIKSALKNDQERVQIDGKNTALSDVDIDRIVDRIRGVIKPGQKGGDPGVDSSRMQSISSNTVDSGFGTPGSSLKSRGIDDTKTTNRMESAKTNTGNGEDPGVDSSRMQSNRGIAIEEVQVLEGRKASISMKADPVIYYYFNQFLARIASDGKKYDGDLGDFVRMCIEAAMADRGQLPVMMRTSKGRVLFEIPMGSIVEQKEEEP